MNPLRRPDCLAEPFQRWFSGSVVVDADGRPLPVYHGTKLSFSTFQAPAWFTPQRDFAECFAGEWGVDGVRDARSRVIEVYLRLKSPVRTDDWDITECQALDPDWRAHQQTLGFDGVLFENEAEIEYIVFDASQIQIVSCHLLLPPSVQPDGVDELVP